MRKGLCKHIFFTQLIFSIVLDNQNIKVFCRSSEKTKAFCSPIDVFVKVWVWKKMEKTKGLLSWGFLATQMISGLDIFTNRIFSNEKMFLSNLKERLFVWFKTYNFI